MRMAYYQDTVRDELVYQLSCGEDGAARLSESVLNRTQHVARRGAVSSHTDGKGCQSISEFARDCPTGGTLHPNQVSLK